jgi:hypothetical protein
VPHAFRAIENALFHGHFHPFLLSTFHCNKHLRFITTSIHGCPIDMPHLTVDQVFEAFDRMERDDELQARDKRCTIKTRAMRPLLRSCFKVQIVHGAIDSYDFGKKEKKRYVHRGLF